MALFGVVLLAWSVRLPFRDARPVPRPVRISFVAFVVALLSAGSQLVQGSRAVLPWDVTAEAAAVYGWFFIGSAAYFAYGLLRPRWHNAAGQLAGFLAYDLVLIVPLLMLLPGIADAPPPPARLPRRHRVQRPAGELLPVSRACDRHLRGTAAGRPPATRPRAARSASPARER